MPDALGPGGALGGGGVITKTYSESCSTCSLDCGLCVTITPLGSAIPIATESVESDDLSGGSTTGFSFGRDAITPFLRAMSCRFLGLGC